MRKKTTVIRKGADTESTRPEELPCFSEGLGTRGAEPRPLHLGIVLRHYPGTEGRRTVPIDTTARIGTAVLVHKYRRFYT